MNRSMTMLTLATALVALGRLAAAQTPLGTDITYQGKLNEGGIPADGDYDFVFRLFDAAQGGDQVGNTVLVGDLAVSGGLFTLQVDFGADVFGTDARWMDIMVRPGAGGAYTQLSPRQPMTAAPVAQYALSAPSGGGSALWSPSGANIYKNNAGNVGIGTSSPQTLLEVRRQGLGDGQVRVFGNSDHGGELQLKSLFDGVGSGNWGRLLFLDSENDAQGWVTYGKGLAGNPALQIGTTAGFMHLDGVNGNLGIGTSTPAAKLHLVNGSSTRPVYIQFTHPTSGLSAVRVDNVSSNSGAAAIAGLNSGGGYAGFFQITNTNNTTPALQATTSGSGDGICGRSESGTGVNGVSNNANAYGGVFGSLDTPGKGLLVVGQSHLVSPVAIGTTAVPAGVMLNVNGTTRTGVLEIAGADIAEKFPVNPEEEIKPGMVLEIDPLNPGRLRIARGAYNRRVAGVVSGAGDIPVGAILGNLPGHDDAPPIALSGRVWVMCDASNGAIQVGDLLTTAESAGCAMRVTDHTRAQGAILGKAMSRLGAGERGLVRVLVSLQ